ncbi:GTP cyclohydrolase II [Trichodelitschia bisporula]|uniref:GTP cyclohydrolase II n=1 Tax=Trichodelitschia bisporula TaxID=703511 RepID=A0A6G1HNP6_9PEZI|nr:GTP cyclohydrolase II [Trichodelitschia bisporula]
MSNSFPAHASPTFPSSHPSSNAPTTSIPAYNLTTPAPLPSIISPAFTPPQTPSNETNTIPLTERDAPSIPVDSSLSATSSPALLAELPTVVCDVRARIPTTSEQELWLHVYRTSIDTKDHLAIVFGSHIRSASLFTPRPGETESDRMIRGAYQGRLFPGRTTSRADSAAAESTPDGTAPEAPTEPETDDADKPPLVRIHSECYTGETIGSSRCDCGEQLDEAQRLMCLPINQSSGGVIVYLRQEGRGIGLSEKLKAYNLQDLGLDTYEANLMLRHPADARSYGVATAILMDLGLGGERGIRLLTNNPDKIRAVEGPRREVVVKERVAMVPIAWQTGGKEGVRGKELDKYLSTKIEKFKHLLG